MQNSSALEYPLDLLADEIVSAERFPSGIVIGSTDFTREALQNVLDNLQAEGVDVTGITIDNNGTRPKSFVSLRDIRSTDSTIDLRVDKEGIDVGWLPDMPRKTAK
jgi:hypothetical protein